MKWLCFYIRKENMKIPLLYSMKRNYIMNYKILSLKYKSDDWGILVNRGDAKKELKKIEEAL